MSKNTKLTQSTSFILAIALPILTALIVGVYIHYNIEGSLVLASLWNTYKIPMTIASLSIPLAAWAIANHRSEHTLKGLELQTNKRLYEMYYEQQKHFEIVMGRRIETAKFNYITAADLPVIFSELYEFNRLHSKGEVSLKPTTIKDIKRFMTKTSDIAYGFYQHFCTHKENKPSQSQALDGYIQQMFEFFHRNLLALSDDLGTPQLELSDMSVKLVGQAYTEVLSLCYYMGEDFKSIWENTNNEDGSNDHTNLTATLEAIESIIQDHMGVMGEATYCNFEVDLSSRMVMKSMQSTPLQHCYKQCATSLFEHLANHVNFDIKRVNVIDGKYDRYEFLPYSLSLREISEFEGEMQFFTPDDVVTEKITITNGTDGQEGQCFVGNDDGSKFIQDCVAALSVERPNTPKQSIGESA